MIYNCDENGKIYMKIYSDWFKFIVMISHNGTPNNGSSFYFVLVTLFTMQTTAIISIQKKDHRHNENKMQKSYWSSNFIIQDIW